MTLHYQKFMLNQICISLTSSKCLFHSACLSYIIFPCEHSSPHPWHIFAAHILRSIHLAIINNTYPRVLIKLCLIQLLLLHCGLLLVRRFFAHCLRISLCFPFWQFQLSCSLTLSLHFWFLLHFIVEHSLPIFIFLLDLSEQCLFFFCVIFRRCCLTSKALAKIWLGVHHAWQTSISKCIFLHIHLHATCWAKSIFNICCWLRFLLGKVCKIVHFIF